MLKALDPLLYTLENNIHFDKNGFINRCYELIKVSIRPPYTLCVDGKEGTGKTSVMKKLYDKLKLEGYPVIWFNPWQQSGKKDLALIFIQRLTMMYRDAIHTKGVECHWRMLPLLLKEGVEMGIRALEKGIFPVKISVHKEKTHKRDNRAVKRGLRDATRQLQVEFFQLIDHISEGNGHKSVIIFFDDLDRLRSIELVKMLNALKNIFISPHLNAIFICGMDSQTTRDSIARMCFDDMKQNAANYLSKIFDLSLRVPPTLLEDTFFVDQLKTLNEWQNSKEEDAERMVQMIRSYGACTPLKGMGYMHRIISQFHAFLLFNPEYEFSSEDDVIINLMVLKDASQYLFERIVEEAMDESLDAMTICSRIFEKDSQNQLFLTWQKSFLLKFYGEGAPFSKLNLSKLVHGNMILI